MFIYLLSFFFIFYVFGQITTYKSQSIFGKKANLPCNKQFACLELLKTAFKRETLYLVTIYNSI